MDTFLHEVADFGNVNTLWEYHPDVLGIRLVSIKGMFNGLGWDAAIGNSFFWGTAKRGEG